MRSCLLVVFATILLLPVVGAYPELQTERRVKAETPLESELLGYSMARVGDQLLVGAPSNGDRPGKVLVYDPVGDSWDLAQTLLADDDCPLTTHVEDESDLFGWAIDTDGVRVIIGAPGHDVEIAALPETNCPDHDTPITWRDGAAYIFSYQNGLWVKEATLRHDGTKYPGKTMIDPGCGYDVAIHGDMAILACPDERPGNANTRYGSVAVFERQIDGTWDQKQRWRTPGTGYNAGTDEWTSAIGTNLFGTSVDLNDEWLVAGGIGYEPPGQGSTTSAGRVLVWRWNTDAEPDRWSPCYHIGSPDRYAHAWFGNEVELVGNDLYVGEPHYRPGGDGTVGFGGVHRIELRTSDCPEVPGWKDDPFYRESITGEAVHHAQGRAEKARFGNDFVYGSVFGVPTLAIGSWRFDSSSIDRDQGRVDIYERSGATGQWYHARTFLSYDAHAHSNGGPSFGWSMALWEDRLVVGAPGDDRFASNAGAFTTFTTQSVQTVFRTLSIDHGAQPDTHEMDIESSRKAGTSPSNARVTPEAPVVFAFEETLVPQQIAGDGWHVTTLITVSGTPTELRFTLGHAAADGSDFIGTNPVGSVSNPAQGIHEIPLAGNLFTVPGGRHLALQASMEGLPGSYLDVVTSGITSPTVLTSDAEFAEGLPTPMPWTVVILATGLLLVVGAKRVQRL